MRNILYQLREEVLNLTLEEWKKLKPFTRNNVALISRKDFEIITSNRKDCRFFGRKLNEHEKEFFNIN